MERNKLATLAIMVCMVSAVSTLPAMLIVGGLQPPNTVNHYYTTNQTNTTVTNTTNVIPPVTNITVYNYTSNTNITYNVNGTIPTVERHVIHMTIILNQTKMFYELFNMTLDRKVTFTDIFVKTNATMPGVASGSIYFESRLFLNGTRIPLYACPSISFQTDGAINEYLDTWQGTNPNWVLEVNPSKMFQFGISCHDGDAPVIPVSLKVEMYFFYEFEVMT
jgi:hypothetical protein